MSFLFGSTICLPLASDSENRPIVRRMSATGLTSEAQLRYMLQWFGEFSELQRDDFVLVLGAARVDKPEQLTAMLAGLSCQDKPMSLFQCRIKLFNEWYPTWTEDEQDRFVKSISEVDPDFGTKLQDIIINGPKVNGDDFGIIESVADDANETHNEVNENQNSEEETKEPVVPQDIIPLEITAAS